VGRFSHALGQRVLEIGAGFGNLTRHLTGRDLVIASDLDPIAVEYLKGAFREHASVEVKSYKFPLGVGAREELGGRRLDTIVICNVLEHIEDDRATLADMFSVLQPGGRLIVLVPALQKLYGTLDVHLRHFRRYEKAELEEKLAAAGFRVEDCRFVNRPGVVGWYVNGRILRRRILPKGQLRAFQLAMPFLRREEKNPPPYGMSLLAIASKPR
jgi:2-polyprenyl-3-methyl-5-hydroxy-6-metoxy-1,4-benzoquinol methylase